MKHMHKKTTPRPSTTRRIRVEEQQNEALKLWMLGVTSRAIGQQLGVSHTTAWRRIQDALDNQRPHYEYSRYRAVQLAELEVSRKLLRKAIASYGTRTKDENGAVVELGPDLDGALAAIKTLLQLQEREAKLLGLDKVPTPVEEVGDMTDAEMEALVTEWQAEMAPA